MLWSTALAKICSLAWGLFAKPCWKELDHLSKLSLTTKNKVRFLVLGVCSAPVDVLWLASPSFMPYYPSGVEDRQRRYSLIINPSFTPSTYLSGICPEILGLNIVNLDDLTPFSSIGVTLKMPWCTQSCFSYQFLWN